MLVSGRNGQGLGLRGRSHPVTGFALDWCAKTGLRCKPVHSGRGQARSYTMRVWPVGARLPAKGRTIARRAKRFLLALRVRSPASWLPQVPCSRRAMWSQIASKLAPTGSVFPASYVEPDRQQAGSHRFRVPGELCGARSPASWLPQVLCPSRSMWEPACWRRLVNRR